MKDSLPISSGAQKENFDIQEAKLCLLADSFTNESAEDALPLQTLVKEGYMTDTFLRQVLQRLTAEVGESKDITLAKCKNVERHLQYRRMEYVPDHPTRRLHVVQEHHNLPAASHPDRAKTLDLLSHSIDWPKITQYVDQYVRNWHTCCRGEALRHSPHGEVRCLPIPSQPWQHVSMDFITRLRLTNRLDTIFMVVARLTKKWHLIPCRITAGTKDLTAMFLKYV